jgi:hypothetical protein
MSAGGCCGSKAGEFSDAGHGRLNKNYMKRIITILSVLACAVALAGGTALAAEKAGKSAKKACGCCEATVEAGKKCKEECCTKAAKEGKVCATCHPKTGGKKKAK